MNNVPMSAGGYPLRREDLVAECCRLRGIVESLKDPVTVHVNMLRGTIAPITVRQAAHIAGDRMVEWLNGAEAFCPPPTDVSPKDSSQ